MPVEDFAVTLFALFVLGTVVYYAVLLVWRLVVGKRFDR